MGEEKKKKTNILRQFKHFPFFQLAKLTFNVNISETFNYVFIHNLKTKYKKILHEFINRNKIQHRISANNSTFVFLFFLPSLSHQSIPI